MKLGGNPNGKLPFLDPDCRMLVKVKTVKISVFLFLQYLLLYTDDSEILD